MCAQSRRGREGAFCETPVRLRAERGRGAPRLARGSSRRRRLVARWARPLRSADRYLVARQPRGLLLRSTEEEAPASGRRTAVRHRSDTHPLRRERRRRRQGEASRSRGARHGAGERAPPRLRTPSGHRCSTSCTPFGTATGWRAPGGVGGSHDRRPRAMKRSSRIRGHRLLPRLEPSRHPTPFGQLVA
jgi:hypothetical protein